MKFGWILLSCIALVCFALLVTIVTAVGKRGVPSSFSLLIIFIVGAIANFATTYTTTKFQFPISPILIAMVIAAGILSFIGNLAQFNAALLAPNAGLAIAVVSVYSGLVAILSVIFFKDQISPLQAVGMAIAIIGVFLIGVGGK